MVVLALVFTALCGIVVLAFALWMKRLRRYAHFKFEPVIPFFGNALSIPSEPHLIVRYMQSLQNKFGPTFIMWLGFKPFMITSDVDMVESLLNSHVLITKSSLYDFLHDWLGAGLLTSSGAKWKDRRRLITPAFHFSVLNSFIPVFERQGKILADKLEGIAKSGLPFDIQGPVSLCALDIICEAAMGVTCNAQLGHGSEYVSAVLALSRHVHLRQKKPYLWPDFIYALSGEGRAQRKSLNSVLRFTRQVISERIEMRSKSAQEVDKTAFLDVLLDSYSKGLIDLEGIREEVDTFMFEGHDTTAAAMSWTLFLLGHHPEVQAKLHAEIDGILRVAHGSVFEQVKNLKYLDSVIKEALRLYPSVSIYARRLDADMIVEGVRVPSGTELGVYAYALHRNPNLCDSPDDFKPERFLSDEFSKRHPYQYLPFSAGPRNCIGQKFALLEEKIVLFHVLKQFQVTSAQNIDKVDICVEIITRSNNGLLVSLKKR